MTLAAAIAPARFEKRFLFIAVTVALVLIAFSCLFPREALGAIHVWIDSRTYNHCFLVLPLALFLVWERRSELPGIPIAPNLKAVAIVFLLGFLWLGVSIIGVLEVQQFIVLTMVQAALGGMLGMRMYRALLGPLLYLYFLVPSGAFLVPALQAFTARFAVTGLHLLGIPVFSTGALIEIPAGNFAVAEACAGLRFLIAAVAFGVFFAILTYRSPWRRALFIALCVVVPVIANGFRALGLIAAAQWIGSASAALADHVLYGWIFFSLVLLALIVIGRSFSDREPSGAGAKAPASPSYLPAGKILTAAIACVLAAVVPPVLALAINRSEMHPAPGVPPRVSAPWQQISMQSGWRPVVLSPTRAFENGYSDGHIRLDRFVATYDWPDSGRRLIRSDNRDADEDIWRFNSAGFTRLQVHGQMFTARWSTWVRGSATRVVWSFYVIGGQIVATELGAKWHQFLALMSRRECAGAYVAVSLEGLTEPEGRKAVGRFLEANEEIPAYLCRNTVNSKPK